MIKVHQHALINQMLYQKKKKIALVRPTEKVSTGATSGKNESRALIFYKRFCKVDPLQFRMMYYSYFYEQKLLQVVSIEKNAIDCTGVSFHSPHKLLDAAHIYLGLTLKHCYMLELF